MSILRKSFIFEFFICLSFVLVFLSCQSVSEDLEQEKEQTIPEMTSGPSSKIGEWIPLYPGIEYNHIINKALPIAVYAYRIDLENPERHVIVSSLTPIDGFETLSKTVPTFAREYDTLVAINGTTFEPYRGEEGLGVNLTTLSIYEGEIQSPQVDPMAALMVMKDGSVELHWPPFDFPNIRFAAGMGPLYLLNGTNRGKSGQRHPRSGVGLSKDGRYLILMVIDGRDPDYSIGATYAEAANWMRDLGCWTAMNLDGGGSSTLVLKDPDTGNFRTVNTPSGPPARGVERPVANHIGIR